MERKYGKDWFESIERELAEELASATSKEQKLVAIKEAAITTHYHRWSNCGQRYDRQGMKVLQYECTICLKMREVLANDG